ncbi:hypothetical protein [Pseudogulbenkiania ferrooxidans]|uniref:hypothetical protein n=1 Tax=Pseudogulbenkiania ferrooxidans TaxID=549169 RepID=UPI001269842A|nr:hypothetical protein [Pseudogulbenkiania ferrooxidans]
MTNIGCRLRNLDLARLVGKSIFLGEEMFATWYFKVERKLFTARLTLITIRRAQKNDKVVSAAGFCIAQEAVQALGACSKDFCGIGRFLPDAGREKRSVAASFTARGVWQRHAPTESGPGGRSCQQAICGVVRLGLGIAKAYAVRLASGLLAGSRCSQKAFEQALKHSWSCSRQVTCQPQFSLSPFIVRAVAIAAPAWSLAR